MLPLQGRVGRRQALRSLVSKDSADADRAVTNKRKGKRVAHFTEDTLQRILINPFYAITAAPQMTEQHAELAEEADWVQENTSYMREIGAEQWLGQLLDVLEGKPCAQSQLISPSMAINIDPLFACEHPPLVRRQMWVDVNAKQIRSMGMEGWLEQLLEVLSGGIVTAEEIGFAPPRDSFGSTPPRKAQSRRSGKRKGNKRRHK